MGEISVSMETISPEIDWQFVITLLFFVIFIT